MVKKYIQEMLICQLEQPNKNNKIRKDNTLIF